MKHAKFLKVLIAMTLPFTACASLDVSQIMEKYLWEKRVVLVFAPSLENAEYQNQERYFKTAARSFKERDIVFWRMINERVVSVDGVGMPQLPTAAFYDYFHAPHDAFTFILLGKDGEEKQRAEQAVSLPALEQKIDAMPMRAQEMKP